MVFTQLLILSVLSHVFQTKLVAFIRVFADLAKAARVTKFQECNFVLDSQVGKLKKNTTGQDAETGTHLFLN